MLPLLIRSPFVKLIFFIFLLSIYNPSFSQSLKGRVDDAVTGDALVGANVLVRETGQMLFVQLDGYFRVKEIKPGQYTIVISYTGYETRTEQTTISPGLMQTLLVPLKPSSRELAAVSVTTDRRSESGARKLEMNAAQLLNVVSARAIELSPDISVGNVLQRVSGVSVQRSSSGDGRYAIIRGLDSRYNYTSIGGIILPSPDATQRSVPLDMFPAEMLQRV